MPHGASRVEFETDLTEILAARAESLDLTMTSYVTAVLWGTVMAGSADSAALRAIDAGRVTMRRPPRASGWTQEPNPASRSSIWRRGAFTVAKESNQYSPWILTGPGMRPMRLSTNRTEALREASAVVATRAPAPDTPPEAVEALSEALSGSSVASSIDAAGEGTPKSESGSNGEVETSPQPAGSGDEPGDSGPPSPAPCSLCGGRGCEEGCGRCERSPSVAGPDAHRQCVRCHGAGVEPYPGNPTSVFDGLVIPAGTDRFA